MVLNVGGCRSWDWGMWGVIWCQKSKTSISQLAGEYAAIVPSASSPEKGGKGENIWMLSASPSADQRSWCWMLGVKDHEQRMQKWLQKPKEKWGICLGGFQVAILYSGAPAYFSLISCLRAWPWALIQSLGAHRAGPKHQELVWLLKQDQTPWLTFFNLSWWPSESQ